MFCGSAQFSVWAVGTAQMIHFILIGDDNLRSRKSIRIQIRHLSDIGQSASRQGQRLLEHVSAVTGRCRINTASTTLNDSLKDIVLSFDLFSIRRTYNEGNCLAERWVLDDIDMGVYSSITFTSGTTCWCRTFIALFLTLSPKGFLLNFIFSNL